MILVDLYFPALNKTYDFMLSTSLEIGLLIDEIVDMISQNENLGVADNASTAMLCSLDSKLVFNSQLTLSSYNVRNGAKLMLV